MKKELEGGWQSKGYDHYDEKTDNEWHQLSMFILVTVPVIMFTIISYFPDRRMKDWAIREVTTSSILSETVECNQHFSRLTWC